MYMYVLVGMVGKNGWRYKREETKREGKLPIPPPPSGICTLMNGSKPSSCLLPEEANVNNEVII